MRLGLEFISFFSCFTCQREKVLNLEGQSLFWSLKTGLSYLLNLLLSPHNEETRIWALSHHGLFFFFYKPCNFSSLPHPQVRFLSDLVNCHVIAAPSMVAMFENFVNVTQEEDVPQVSKGFFFFWLHRFKNFFLRGGSQILLGFKKLMQFLSGEVILLTLWDVKHLESFRLEIDHHIRSRNFELCLPVELNP